MSPPRCVLPILVCFASPLCAENLPPRAIARLGDHRFYHGPGLACAVLSPDGRRVASSAHSRYTHLIGSRERGAYDAMIVLWNAATGERIRDVRAPHSPVRGLAFSPDGKRLAAVCEVSSDRECVALFEANTGKLLQQFGAFSRVGYLTFSGDGKQVRVSEWLGPASAWDAGTGKRLRLWNLPPAAPRRGEGGVVGGVRGIVSPDGEVIVWEMGIIERGSSSETVGMRVHDSHSDKLLYQKDFKLHRRLISFVFSSDGKRFAAYSEKLVVWEAATGKELAGLEIPDMWRFTLAPDNRHALVCQTGCRVRLWDLKTGKPSRDISDGSVLTNAEILDTPQVFSADGKTLLLATDTTLRVLDLTNGNERATTGRRSGITPRFSPDGRTLFTSCREARCAWDVSGKAAALLKRELRKAWELEALAFSADARLFLDRSDGPTRVRETASGRTVRNLETVFGFPGFGLFSPDAGRVLLYYSADKKPLPTGQHQAFHIYDVKTGKKTGEIEPGNRAGNPVFSPDGRLVALADNAAAVHLHDSGTGKAVRTLRSSLPVPEGKGSQEDIRVLFSPDSERLITTSYLFEIGDKPELEFRYTLLPARIFHVAGGKEVRRFFLNPEKTSNGAPLSCAAWSPDGRLLAIAERGTGTVRLLEIASGKVRAELAGHHHGVHGLAFSSDGK